MTSFQLPSFPEMNKEELEGTFWGTQDFGLINEALIRAVRKYKNLNYKIAENDRKKTKAQLEYNHKFREFYLNQDERKSEFWKKTATEFQCEKEEVRLLYLEEISKELNRQAQELKFELETLKTLGFNIRAEINI